ncbi:uncharacterized protein BDV17DRAFT_49762 [Aspergillus undulatus]|uniref:uncharacterized protein n=1 Tax=Aspergillus undulatus TaxID=1810928 RepID=UPI003CCCA89C
MDAIRPLVITSQLNGSEYTIQDHGLTVFRIVYVASNIMIRRVRSYVNYLFVGKTSRSMIDEERRWTSLISYLRSWIRRRKRSWTRLLPHLFCRLARRERPNQAATHARYLLRQREDDKQALLARWFLAPLLPHDSISTPKGPLPTLWYDILHRSRPRLSLGSYPRGMKMQGLSDLIEPISTRSLRFPVRVLQGQAQGLYCAYTKLGLTGNPQDLVFCRRRLVCDSGSTPQECKRLDSTRVWA